MSIFSNKNKKSGFTLIELLVTIAVIGVLSTLAVIALGNVRMKSRDSKRMSDIRQIGLALDLYYADNSSYPTIITPGQSLTSPDGSKVYLAKIPSNPRPRNDNNAPDLDYVYTPNSITTPNNYSLTTNLGTSVNNIPAGTISYSPNGLFNCGQQISDVDGNTYNTVQIGSQCWMKENLKVGTMVLGVNDQTNNSVIEKYCPSDNAANCTTYGGLYQWAEAVQYLNGATNTTDWNPAPAGVVYGICPVGWHIPTIAEFQILSQNYDPGCDLTASSCSTSGGFLKEDGTTHWNSPNTGATNASGFTALPTGFRSSANGGFYLMGQYAFLWSSLPLFSDPLYAWHDGFFSAASWSAGRSSYKKATGLSVRCLKD